MKRTYRILLPVLCIVTLLLSACGGTSGVENSESATTRLEKSAPDENGYYAVTEELLSVLKSTEYTKPKNIIYMIGDGMGANIIQATQEKYESQLYGNKLAIHYLSKVGTHCTYSASDKITDSAAGGTALATGYKTANYTVGMNTDHTKEYKSVLELAAEKGKSTGIIATKSVTDATPAAFTAHVEDRKMQNEIANQQLEKLLDGTLDLVLGGGSEYYEYYANEELLEEAEDKGLSYSKMWEETLDDKLPLVGLYARDALNTTASYVPTLAEMTHFALNLLSEDENGFFLMVEGSQIDTKAHDNELEKEINEMYMFDSAIAVAMRYVALHPDTVLIVTADHETGGLYFPKEGYGHGESYIYLRDDHTQINVPVYALGHGIETLGETTENTDIAGFVASLLGEEEFGEESVVTNISDGTETITLTFDENGKCQEIWTEELATKIELAKNVRALHLTVCNVGDERVTLPALKIQIADGTSYDAIPQYAYIDKGETLRLTYVLPVELWQDSIFVDVNSIQISYDTVEENAWRSTFGYDVEEVVLGITEIAITERGLEQ